MSADTVRLNQMVKKLDSDGLTPAEETELADRSLAKIKQYMDFFARLNVGVDLSTNFATEVKRLRRYMKHRLDTIK